MTVSRSEMMREGIPKRRASMSKTTRGNVETRLREEIGGGDWGRQNEADAMKCKDVAKMTT